MFGLLFPTLTMYAINIYGNVETTPWTIRAGECLHLNVNSLGILISFSTTKGASIEIILNSFDFTPIGKIPSNKSVESIYMGAFYGKIILKAEEEIKILITAKQLQFSPNDEIKIHYDLSSADNNQPSPTTSLKIITLDQFYALAFFIVSILLIALLSFNIYQCWLKYQSRHDTLNDNACEELLSDSGFDSAIPPVIMVDVPQQQQLYEQQQIYMHQQRQQHHQSQQFYGQQMPQYTGNFGVLQQYPALQQDLSNVYTGNDFF